MTRIEFHVVSVEMNKNVIDDLKPSNLIELKIIQKPCGATDEFFVNDAKTLEHVDHEFYIEDHFNNINKIILMIKSVQSCLFNLEELKKEKLSNVEICDENANGNIKKDFEKDEIPNSIIGYCSVDLSKMEKKSNHILRVQLLSKPEKKVVGYANLEIYIWKTLACGNENEKGFASFNAKPIQQRKILRPFVL